MFILDSLMISGISWALRTAITAAEAEMNDDTALREQLLAAEMDRETGEITDADFEEIERELLGRIREIKERREGGSGPLAFGDGEPIETSEDSRFQIEASVSGDFYDPGDAPHTIVVDTEPARSGMVGTRSGQTLAVLDVEPVRAETLEGAALPLPRSKRDIKKRPTRRKRSRTPVHGTASPRGASARRQPREPRPSTAKQGKSPRPGLRRSKA